MSQHQGTSNYWDKPPGRKTLNSQGELGNLPPPGTTASQQQLNPEIIVQQPHQSFNRSPGNNTTTRQQRPSGSTAAISTSVDTLQPWRVDLSLNHLTATSRSSTPQDNPPDFRERRSPSQPISATTDIELEDDLQFQTPGGPAAASRNPQQNASIILAGDITKDLSKEQLTALVQILEDNIESFGTDFRNQVGWRGRLKPHIANLTESIRKLISNAKRLQATGELQKLYPLETTLNEHAENLSKIAEAEREAEGSPFIFRPSILTTPAAAASLLTHHESLENLGREGSIVEDAVQSETEDSNRTRTSRIPTNQALKTIDMKLKSLEIRKADLQNLDQIVQALGAKASKADLSNACMRICNLESKTTIIDDLQSNLNDLHTNMEEGQGNTKVLIDGLCRDGSHQETKLEEALEAIAILRSEIDGIRNQLDQSRATSNDSTTHQGLSGFHNGAPVYRRSQQPSVSGISVYPTQAIATTVNSITPGYTHTSFVMTSGTRPTSCIAPTSFPQPQVLRNVPQTSLPIQQQNPCVPQPGTQTSHYLQAPPGFHLVPNTDQNTAQTNTAAEAYQRTRSTAASRGQQSIRQSSRNLQAVDTDIDSDNQSDCPSAAGSKSRSERGSLSEDEHLSRAEFLLRNSKNALKDMLKPPVDNKLTKTVVQGVLKTILPAVDSERKDLQKMINSYAKDVQSDEGRRLMNNCQYVVEEARRWANGMRNKYNELDCAKQPLDTQLFEGLKKFNEKSDVNIFEFLSRFESYTEEKGTAKERAALLYESYLHKDIQMMLIEHKEDYARMRFWLIKRYGDAKVMTDSIIRTVSKDRIPSDTNASTALTNYYRRLNSVFKKIQELERTQDMPAYELQNYIYSAGFIEKLMGMLPEKARFKFYKEQLANQEDLHRFSGRKAFESLAEVVQKEFNFNEAETRLEIYKPAATDKSKTVDQGRKVKEKGRGIHSARKASNSSSSSSEEDNCQRVHYQKAEPSKGKKTQSKPGKGTDLKAKEKPKGNGNGQEKGDSFKFPCSLQNHHHELGSCETFFTAKPGVRYRAAYKKMCFRCLGPISKCLPKCTSTKIPKVLVCDECTEYAEKNDRIPNNILICNRTNHSKPDEKVILDALKKYLVGFKTGEVQGKLTLAAHFHLSANAASSDRPTLSSKPDPNSDIPIIDTCTGELIETNEENIIPESKEDAFYIMQILNLRGQDVLTFYDSGANSHLIDGSLAEDIGLKVTNENGVNIQVVGGNKMWSNYGTYAMTLGPNEEDDYHQISAQGVGVISKRFNHYDFEQINQEVRESGELPKKYKALPKYIGGQAPRLLLGIKDTGLNPELLFQLPCGLGVYRSQLKDKFGSRICYGGPHETFTEANKVRGTHFNQVNAFFLSMATEYQNSPYLSIAHHLQPEYEDTGHGVMMANYDKHPRTIVTKDNIVIHTNTITEETLQSLDMTEEDDAADLFCACEPVNDSSVSPQDIESQIAIHKAKVPVSRKKEYFDEEDQGFVSTYRCEDCTKCKKCSFSDKTKMMSLQEKMEQEAIEKSVHIDLQQRKVFVDLPFIKPPVEALKKRHNSDSNYKQALRIYQTQCRKPLAMKSAMVKVQKDLVEKGFMMKLSDLNQGQSMIIQKAGFKHYMPWNIAEKPDSSSTPVRMVVDASVTGLNEILAKGENKMSKINHILIRNRCRRYIWTSDISKLYNQLHLNDSALPYALFLFNDSLSLTDPPEVYVMTRAWYGVSPTGNQSTEALVRLTNSLKEDYPLAVSVVKDDLYVDDTITGSNDASAIEQQIHETLNAFAQGGFSLKYVVKSGEDPCEQASPNETSLKILGYKWSPKEDMLNPGFGEINFNKKRRGAKKPNPFAVETPKDVSRLLNSTNITRRIVVSKIAEIYDPVGIWEPFKLQLKLDNSYLNGNEWDVPLNAELQTHWKERFKQFLYIPAMEATRCIIPPDAVNPNNLRLLCLSDAAESAGGCAVYASFERTNGQYSCQLLTARSKLMAQKIPRNELEAIKLMAETVNNVKQALGDQVKETLYFTDSTIAMCWCHNISKKLRMYTLYRVADIRRNILGSAYHDQELPLYHIDGKLNVADYLTKHHSITPEDMSSKSVWQTGYPWMTLPLEKMPITSYKQLTISKEDMSTIDQECFPEPIMSKDHTETQDVQAMHLGIDTMHCAGCQSSNLTSLLTCYGFQNDFDHCDNCLCTIQFSSFALKAGKGMPDIADIIKLGWPRTIFRLSLLIKLFSMFTHTAHTKKGEQTSNRCNMCKALESSDDKIEQDKYYTQKAKEHLFRQETSRIKSIMPAQKLKQFTEHDGILYYESRLSTENQITQSDLDVNVFFDNSEITTMLPVVLSDSEIYFAYVIHVHHKIRPHSGVEITFKEVSKTMMVLNNARKIIQRIRNHCPRCRIIKKRTVELRMLHHPAARTHLSPPFYHCQVDTVFGFKGQAHKNARKTFKIYALIIVCLLTGATSILAMEGLETQDVVQAIERHSARHGVPAVMYVDNGTQLIALEHADFKLRDVETQVHDSLGMRIIVSNAKSHEERGRVEAKVKILREMMEKLSVSPQSPMTAIQWETLFAKIGNMIDDVPLAKCTNSNLADPGWDVITANRLKLGRNNNRSLEGSVSLPRGVGADTLLKRNQDIQRVWYQMLIDRIHHLIPRPAKWKKTDEVRVDDICLFIYSENSAMKKDVWKLGRITEIPKKNKVIIKFPGNPTNKGLPTSKYLARCPRDISIISAAGDVELNSRKFYNELLTKPNKI